MQCDACTYSLLRSTRTSVRTTLAMLIQLVSPMTIDRLSALALPRIACSSTISSRFGMLMKISLTRMKNASSFSPAQPLISICLISLFVTFVMITGGIDIQAGSIVGLTSIVIGVFWQDFGLNIWGAVLLAVAIAALCGALSGFFVAYCGVQAMVVTLGGQFLYAGLALLVSTLSSTESYQGISGFPDSFKAITSFKLFGVIPSQVLIFLAMTVIAWLLLHKSKYGRKVFLVGVNPQAAEYSGINTRRVILSTYVLSAVSASVAGIVLTSYLGTAKSDLGSTLTMNIITACVLGGTLSTGGKGSAIGTALASLIIGLMRFGMPLCFKVNTQYLDIPIGILLIVVVVGRAAASHPKTAALLARLKKKKAQPAAKAAK